MLTFIYRCPATGQNVQGWIAEDGSATEADAFHPMTCLACRRVHLVNPASGRTPQEPSMGRSATR